MQLDGSGLEQWEAMQEERDQKESACPFPGSPDPTGLGGSRELWIPKWSHPPPASYYLLHSGSRLGGGRGRGGALEAGRGSARAAVDGL